MNLRSDFMLSLRVPRKLRRFAGMAVVALALVGCGLSLRPQFAGGQTGYVIVSGQSMRPTLHPGDLVMVERQSAYQLGEVVAYHIPAGAFRGRKIIHRIVGGDPMAGFVMRGDNNRDDDLWRPRTADIEGRLWKRLPTIGWLVAFIRTPAVLAAVAAGFAFAFVMTWKPNPDGKLSGAGH